MLSPETGNSLFQELESVLSHPRWTDLSKLRALRAVLEELLDALTQRENLALSTLFARLSYVGHQYRLGSKTRYALHQLRRDTSGNTHPPTKIPPVAFYAGALAQAISRTAGLGIPVAVADRMLDPELSNLPRPNTANKFLPAMRVVVVADHPDQCCLEGVDHNNPENHLLIKYNQPELNSDFNGTLEVIRKVFGFPVTVQLLEVNLSEAGHYLPRAIVIEPDFLLDVSSVSECFKDTGPDPYVYLISKLLPKDNTDALLLGNIANSLLDHLMNEPDAVFQKINKVIYRQFPLALAQKTDAQIRELNQKVKLHFEHIQRMVRGGLQKQGIETRFCQLEPTFFSEQYGLQGRLDLFFNYQDKKAIVELKSGSAYRPNIHGIQRSHFTQTLLYDLLIRSVFGKNANPAKYILYSGAAENTLRFAPTVAKEQWEALQIRNRLIGMEKELTDIKAGTERCELLSKLRSDHAVGFLRQNFSRFENVYQALSPTERKYYLAFIGFIAREHWRAKVGEENQEKNAGHAALWRKSLEEKQSDYAVLNHLKLVKNHANQAEPILVFEKTGETDPLANFRVGDISILYPVHRQNDTVLNHQIIRCTITAISAQEIAVQLKFQQFNLQPFETDALWRIEPDTVEISFAAMYRSLFLWAESEPEIRARIMAPEMRSLPLPPPSSLPEKMMQASHFFLLWGPPGSGKTSVVIRDYTRLLLDKTTDNILLLAYTNRAVDEICAMLEAVHAPQPLPYVRLGSRHATAEQYRSKLLGSLLAHVNNRSEILEIVSKPRIFVGTLSSFTQQEELLKMKTFERLVLDEASQIIEPQLVGILTKFRHVVLVGDHRQLPAVTAQPEASCAVTDADLNDIGLTDLRNSYFERMYQRCKANKQFHHFDQLRHQGRMHQDIMEFPGHYFYDDQLEILPNRPEQQTEALFYDLTGKFPHFDRSLGENRVVFLESPEEDYLPGQKTSLGEATLLVQLVHFFKDLYAANDLVWLPHKTLGIITPWRAQIAQIRQSLMLAGFSADDFSIDTVERYQGSARDIILVSTCVHHAAQMSSLTSLSAENIDRKLNVALTRARHHLIVVGKSSVLNQSAHYREFIRLYKITR